VREGACIGAVTMPQPWTLRLILNAAALAAASPTLFFRDVSLSGTYRDGAFLVNFSLSLSLSFSLSGTYRDGAFLCSLEHSEFD